MPHLYIYCMNNEKMIMSQIIARGISNPHVLQAMRTVDRRHFVPKEHSSETYRDSPLPIGSGQTISQPYIVAYMTELLQLSPGMKTLEIGTGSGYQSAILAECGADLYTIEYSARLAESSQKLLTDLGYTDIHFKTGSGYKKWNDAAPFDRIIVTCAPQKVPEVLLQQLAVDGIMVIPVGVTFQVMKTITRHKHSFTEEDGIYVRFVPMRH